MPLALRSMLVAIAGAGTIAGHLLAYALAEPDHSERAHLLAATGHHHLSWWTTGAFVLLIAALSGFAFTRRREVSRSGPSSVARFSFKRLLVIQLLLFVALEMTERALSGGDPTSVFSEKAVLLGMALQMVSALVSACKLYIVSRLVDAVSKRRMHAGGGFAGLPRTYRFPVHVRFVSTWGSRAPPLNI